MKLYVDPGLRACGVAVFDEGLGRPHEADRLVAAGFPESAFVGKDRALAVCFMVEAVERWAAKAVGPRIDQVFVELPQVYDRRNMSARKRGTDPNDLIMLAAVVGGITVALGGRNVTPRLVLPHEWKGTIPKDIMHARAIDGGTNGPILTPAELAVIPKLAKGKVHNVLDAVCMGLVMAGRLRTGGLGPCPV